VLQVSAAARPRQRRCWRAMAGPAPSGISASRWPSRRAGCIRWPYVTPPRVSICIGRWSEVSFRIQEMRDNLIARAGVFAPGRMRPIRDSCSPPLDATTMSRDPHLERRAPAVRHSARQGVNSRREDGRRVHAARDSMLRLHMTDILSGRVRLDDSTVWSPAGGCFVRRRFLGAGRRMGEVDPVQHLWRREEFAAFLARDATFSLWACATACQMFSALRADTRGGSWPRLVRNRRSSMSALDAGARSPSQSVLMAGHAGLVCPYVVAPWRGFRPSSIQGRVRRV